MTAEVTRSPWSRVTSEPVRAVRDLGPRDRRSRIVNELVAELDSVPFREDLAVLPMTADWKSGTLHVRWELPWCVVSLYLSVGWRSSLRLVTPPRGSPSVSDGPLPPECFGAWGLTVAEARRLVRNVTGPFREGRAPGPVDRGGGTT